MLVNDVEVYAPFDPKTEAPGAHSQFVGLWDTGATGTVITQKVVDALALVATGFANVKHAYGDDVAETYFVNVMLPNRFGVPMLRVTKGKIPGADLLVGMDIIGRGDFAVSNFAGKTTFTFRVPSCYEIDYVNQSAQAPGSEKVGRNDPCPCGSRQKYKHCHGR